MKILLTGASGFLGRILFERLIANGHEVNTLSRTAMCDYRIDLATDCEFTINKQYDMVIHAAGKAHMAPKTPEEKKAFYNVNYNGTINLLKALEANPPATFIFISTVAVYGLEGGTNLDENQPLNAVDPYGESKKMAEKYLTEWCDKKQVPCTIFRLPLVAGQQPVGNLLSMMRSCCLLERLVFTILRMVNILLFID
jgi:nucleoside-diphosphate-sugar epimerase